MPPLRTPSLLPRVHAVLLTLIVTLCVTAQPLAERYGPDGQPPINLKRLEKQGEFASPDIVSPDHIMELLPQELPSEKRESARLAVLEASPRLQKSSKAFVRAYDQLRELSFSRDTPPDCLSKLGYELSASRKELRRELRRLSRSIENITGYNPRLDDPKTHPMVKHVRR